MSDRTLYYGVADGWSVSIEGESIVKVKYGIRERIKYLCDQIGVEYESATLSHYRGNKTQGQNYWRLDGCRNVPDPLPFWLHEAKEVGK